MDDIGHGSLIARRGAQGRVSAPSDDAGTLGLCVVLRTPRCGVLRMRDPAASDLESRIRTQFLSSTSTKTIPSASAVTVWARPA